MMGLHRGSLCQITLILGIIATWVYNVAACSGRQVYNASNGIITDGVGNYDQASHCEWLIQATGSNQFISLNFVSMETECAYDYLFIYDGESYSSELLGSFSGGTLPDRVLASSGYMLIYFFSDRNYVRIGFNANFSATPCPHNCSAHGACNELAHQCTCWEGYTGKACETEVCPTNCSHHGACDQMKGCVCSAGFIGRDCNVTVNSTIDTGGWQTIAASDPGFTARAGHAGVFMPDKCLYVFGGNTLNTFLDDLVRFCLQKNKWENVIETGAWPTGRHGHAVARYRNRFYMYGGIVATRVHSEQLWWFDTITLIWHFIDTASDTRPPGLASHSLTAVDDTWLYLFGGQRVDEEFISDIYRIDIENPIHWEKVPAIGGKLSTRRLSGHSTVYHPASKSLLVFGGFTPSYARFPKRTNLLHSYHVEKNQWTQINYGFADSMEPPLERAFHSASIIGNYMVIVGGNAHIHHRAEVCFDGDVYYYHLGCHRWILRETLEEPFRVGTRRILAPKGRYSHVADLAFGNTLLIAGGYRGNVLGDLLTYSVPVSVAKNELSGFSPGPLCPLYVMYEHCIIDPECVWCTEPPSGIMPACTHRNQAKMCRGMVRSGDCPGICNSLHDCSACTVLGQGTSHMPDNTTYWLNEQCVWCVKEQQCQKTGELHGACNGSEGTLSGLTGWWGNTSMLLTQVSQCRTLDWPAGLHFIKYRFPPNFSNPDEVEIIRESRQKFQFSNLYDAEVALGGEYTVEFRGFLHPIGAEPYVYEKGKPLQTYLIVAGGQGWLNISTDETMERQEEVAALNAATYTYEIAERVDGTPIFPNEQRGHKYYMSARCVQKIADRGTTQVSSVLREEWTAKVGNSQQPRQPFTAEFLEPYNGAPCGNYISCMACMTDTHCGWCDTSATCVSREDTQTSVDLCGMIEGARHLVLNHTDCVVCEDYLDCFMCTEDMLCEWLTSEARCVRRGRFSIALVAPEQCPEPCYVRTNCSWCILDENECAWCEETQTCFPFMGYILRHNYGGCTHWVDSMSEQRCHDCSRYSTCHGCVQEYLCGWCGNVEDPTYGVCLHGDFTGPDYPDNHDSCSAVIADRTPLTLDSDAEWSYGVCPDIHECNLGYHDCHNNATCSNTFDSYVCTCDRGFQGDGKTTCERTCYYDCVHGLCSGPPEYQCLCSVGWTGEECNVNCGCNNHSYCEQGIGMCDLCVDYTTGQHCEMCAPGSYGNATALLGCMPCPCNGHADPVRGLCDNQTGTCYCTDNTEGTHCQSCKHGYYGDPSNGGKCYLRCDGRMILGNVTSGSLGTQAGDGVADPSHAYCLWIITVHEDLKNLRLLDIMPTITFTMETDIKTTCGRDYVYVFDGIPSFASSDPSEWAPLLAAYCGYHHAEPQKVEAVSGYLTVFYEANMEPSSTTRGFNASYYINACPTSCHGNRVCRGTHCDCRDHYGGIDCELDLCPGDCSERHQQGQCDMEVGQCVCRPGYGDLSCNATINTDSTTYEPVHDAWRRDGIGAFMAPRAVMGHTVVTCDEDDVYMYGGYSFTHHGEDETTLWKYNVNTNDWDAVIPTSVEKPRNRHFHAAVCIPSQRAMFVFGGLVTDDHGRVNATNEMWKFNLQTERWTLLENPKSSKVHIPPLAGHSMTVIMRTKIWIIGGFSSSEYFNQVDYEFNTSSLTWSELAYNGVKPTGIYGHSAVYHASSDAVYIYGGYEYQTDKMVMSSNLYAIDLRQKLWSLLPSIYGNKPIERTLHTAVSMDDYMVVLGGGTAQADFDGSVWAYKYDCNHWTNISPGVPGVLGNAHTAVRGAAAIRIAGDIYLFAGYDSLMHATVSRIHLPYDLCTLNVDPKSCEAMYGCDMCSVKETNATYCYDNSGTRPVGCLQENTTLLIQEGVSCSADLVTGRACSHHKTCSECLARWPAHQDHDDVCKWCSNCPMGMCVRKEADCEHANPCERQQQVIEQATSCVERFCQAADCNKCWNHGNCIWTRQFKRSSEVGRTLSLMPIYDWNCVTKSLLDATPYPIESSPPTTCPRRCFEHRSCAQCLSSKGGEGGSQECYWSITANECLAPAYLPLRCTSGSCGHIQSGPALHCPGTCSSHTHCSSCLAMPGCGWCALGGMNGLGVCMEGGLMSPLYGVCTTGNITKATEPLSDTQLLWIRQSTSPPTWAFAKCPGENECLNGHNACDDNEDCTNLNKGYQCDCKPGYARDNSTRKCKPHCRAGCEPHGTCKAPDVCSCHFGYVGQNCTTECLCNKHSECDSIEKKHICKSCQNNTQGDQCSMCKPCYVGDPINGGECKSCFDVCNQHSGVCLSQTDLNRTVLFNTHTLDSRVNMSHCVSSGPPSAVEAICIHCANNTMNTHCETCKRGHFRLEGQPLSAPCQKCQCHGHSDTCERLNGVNCICQNNTKTASCDTSSAEKQCYKHQVYLSKGIETNYIQVERFKIDHDLPKGKLVQLNAVCAECVENFLGTPTEGHQCYRQMVVDHDYCFDPTTQSNCYRDPEPLHFGRTVFYAVQPKYLNVHIRLTLDVTYGGVDVYLANLENAFIVDVDKVSGLHTIHADPAVYSSSLPDIVNYPRPRRSTASNQDLLDHSTQLFLRKRRDADGGSSRRHSGEDSKEVFDTASNSSVPYQLRVIDGKDINTFVTLKDSNTILVVRNLEHRLVVTLPSHVHDLKKALFYIILHSVGTTASNETTGVLFFRQDQAHIDLFVFFSVFFSSFFLFLDLCVLIWKMKQAFDSQRSRHRRQLEMECMASRPFGHVLMVTEDECAPTYESQSLLSARKTSNRRLTMPKLASKYSLGTTNMAFTKSNTDDTFRINPLALEPTDDGIAAIGTFVVELPGGRETQTRMCLGSTLLTMRMMYPSIHHATQAAKPHRPDRRERCPSGHVIYNSGTI